MAARQKLVRERRDKADRLRKMELETKIAERQKKLAQEKAMKEMAFLK